MGTKIGLASISKEFHCYSTGQNCIIPDKQNKL